MDITTATISPTTIYQYPVRNWYISMQILVGTGISTPDLRKILTNLGITRVSRIKKAAIRKNTTITG